MKAILTLSHDYWEVSSIGFSNRVALVFSRLCRASIYPSIHLSIYLSIHYPFISLSIHLSIQGHLLSSSWMQSTVSYSGLKIHLCFSAGHKKIPQNPAPFQRWNSTPDSSIVTNAHHLAPSLLVESPRPDGSGCSLFLHRDGQRGSLVDRKKSTETYQLGLWWCWRRRAVGGRGSCWRPHWLPGCRRYRGCGPTGCWWRHGTQSGPAALAQTPRCHRIGSSSGGLPGIFCRLYCKSHHPAHHSPLEGATPEWWTSHWRWRWHFWDLMEHL